MLVKLGELALHDDHALVVLLAVAQFRIELLFEVVQLPDEFLLQVLFLFPIGVLVFVLLISVLLFIVRFLFIGMFLVILWLFPRIAHCQLRYRQTGKVVGFAMLAEQPWG